MDRIDAATLNGTHNSQPSKPSKTPKPTKGSKSKTPPAKGSKGNARQAAAYVGFGVAAALVVLSLSHLTEAIAVLTGSHWALALLLATS